VWDLILPAVASLAGGYLSGQGAKAGGDATANAAKDATELQRQIYYDQRGLAKPAYLTGGAAANKLAAIYGIAPQNYNQAFMGGNNYGLSTTGNMLSANLGAGQPVAGHSGGGGNYGLEGGLIGGLIRKGGDNWQTVATQAPAGYDYEAYMKSPGLEAEWAKPDVQALFNGNRDAYAYWHANGGVLNGKPSWAANMEYLKEVTSKNPNFASDQSTMPVGGTQQEAMTGGNKLLSPMEEFTASPYGQMAISGFRGVDTPEINGAFARGGKLLSGAQSKALDERGKARMGGAFNDYTNGLRAMAGMNQTASSQIGSAAGQYGANAGNNMILAGQAKGNALAGAYQGYANGISGALGAVNDYGKSNNWWG